MSANEPLKNGCEVIYEMFHILNWDFSGVYYTQLLKLCSINCDDHSLLDFKSAVQYMKHFIYHFTSILHGLIRTHK